MDDLLDRFFKELESSLWPEFPRYTVKVSQLKGSFFALVEKARVKNLNDDRKCLYDNVKCISENIYQKYAEYSRDHSYGYFPFFKLVKGYGNYHYHFLVAKKEYE